MKKPSDYSKTNSSISSLSFGLAYADHWFLEEVLDIMFDYCNDLYYIVDIDVILNKNTLYHSKH